MASKKQLIFLGAPGSGKGTQAAKLVANEGYNHVSTGDLLRAEIKKSSALGKRVDGILKAGELVDNETVLELLQVNCDLASGSYLFDGYPRNVEQAKSLDSKILKDAPKLAVYFSVKLELLISRLTNRRTCKSCNAIFNLKTLPPKVEGTCDHCGKAELIHRADDKEEVIRNRMEVFESAITPMVDYYKEQGNLITVDASTDAESLYSEICSAMT